MKIMPIVMGLIALIVVGGFSDLGAATDPKSCILSSNDWVKSVDARVKKKKLTIRYFANIGGQEHPVDWREFPSKKAVDKYCSNGCNDKATLYFSGKAPILAKCFFTSTGTWFMYANYYFRDNGTIARVDSDLRRQGAFVGDKSSHEDRFMVRALCSKYFDEQGGFLIQKPYRYYNMDSGKEVEDPQGFIQNDCPVYVTVMDMPINRFFK